MAVSHNDKYITTCGDSYYDKVLTWDWESLKSINYYQGKKGSFSPGYKYIGTIDHNSIFIWEVISGKWSLAYWGAMDLAELIIETCERFKNHQLTPEERKKYNLD